MNRNQEYLELTRELETLRAPGNSAERALARQRAQRRGRYVIRPLIGLAAVFAVFVLLVNVSPTVAQACSKVPVLRDLAAAVQFSRSLSEAVENEYYQRVDQSKTVDGITVSVDYVIVDQKTVNIFYRVENAEGPVHDTLIPMVTLPDGTEGNWSIVWHKSTEESDNPTEYCGVEFRDRVSSQLLLRFDPRGIDAANPGNAKAPFEFLLEFDPEFTAQGRHYKQDKVLDLDGQRIRITGIDVYPSYLSFSIEGEPENTAWLTGLDYYLLTEDGTRYDWNNTGVFALWDPEKPEWRSFRTDSLFFRDAASVTLCVTGASWMQKGAETQLDLKNGTAEGLPANVELVRTVRDGSGWRVTLLVRGEQAQCFQYTCYDPDGGEHSLGAWYYGANDPDHPESGEAPEGSGYWTFALEDYPWDEVRLTPTQTAESSFAEPVTAVFDLKP